MKKRSLSFRAVCSGSYLHCFFLGDKRRLGKAALCVVASVCISAGASAQCDTFRNADEANPLLSAFPAGKKIAGFAFADIDGDGDQDVYISYQTTSYPPQRTALHLFRNTGNKEHPVYEEDNSTGFGNIKAGYQNPFMQFVDIDGDGDLDYYASEDALGYYDFGSIVFCENVGTATTPKFKIGGNDPTPYISSHVYQPFAFADVDGDGDFDLYVSDESNGYGFSYYHRIYYNTGTKKKGVFDLDNYYLNTIDESTNRTYYDWNKDGLLDFFGVGYYTGNYIKNIGRKGKPRYKKAPDEGPAFENGTPYRMIDLNNDGAPEAFDFGAHYYVLTPLAVITDTVVKRGNKPVTILSSQYTNRSYTYRWELNAKTIAGATGYYIVPDKTGTYTLYVTSQCGTGISLNYEFKNTASLLSAGEKVTGAEESVVGIRAYPNPFVNSITLQLPGKPCTVVITDMAGRILLSKSTSATTLQTGESLKAGAYLLTVYQSGKPLFSKTIIKQ